MGPGLPGLIPDTPGGLTRRQLAAVARGRHRAAKPRGAQVGHVAIGAWMARQPGATAPEEIAPLYWDLHTHHDQVEKVFFPSEQPTS